MRLRHQLFLASFMLATALGSWIWIQGGFWQLTWQEKPKPIQGPDFSIQHLKSEQFNGQGQLKYALEAQALHHYPNGIAHLNHPTLIFHPVDAASPPWQIQSWEGQVDDFAHQVVLNTKVTLRQSNHPWVLTTDTLTIDLENGLAETHQPVTITHPGGKLKAGSLQAHLHSREIRLLRSIQGIYETQ